MASECRRISVTIECPRWVVAGEFVLHYEYMQAEIFGIGSN